jgi:hypothetical protein
MIDAICFDCKVASGGISTAIDKSIFSDLCAFRQSLFLLWQHGWNKDIRQIASAIGKCIIVLETFTYF